MSTFRIVRRSRYTTIDQATVNDERISFKAKGLLLWLLDKPDDWTVSAERIARVGPDGRDAIRSALAELEAAGYIRRSKQRNPDGTFLNECLVYERPDAGGTDGGKPDVGDAVVSSKTKTKDVVPMEPTVPQQRPPDVVWDALTQELGTVCTPPERSRRGKVVRDLKAAEATPEQIHERCAEYRRRWPKVSLTDTALLSHWSKLAIEQVEQPRMNDAERAFMRRWQEARS